MVYWTTANHTCIHASTLSSFPKVYSSVTGRETTANVLASDTEDGLFFLPKSLYITLMYWSKSQGKLVYTCQNVLLACRELFLTQQVHLKCVSAALNRSDAYKSATVRLYYCIHCNFRGMFAHLCCKIAKTRRWFPIYFPSKRKTLEETELPQIFGDRWCPWYNQTEIHILCYDYPNVLSDFIHSTEASFVLLFRIRSNSFNNCNRLNVG